MKALSKATLLDAHVCMKEFIYLAYSETIVLNIVMDASKYSINLTGEGTS